MGAIASVKMLSKKPSVAAITAMPVRRKEEAEGIEAREENMWESGAI
jgi:hypothetical protein